MARFFLVVPLSSAGNFSRHQLRDGKVRRDTGINHFVAHTFSTRPIRPSTGGSGRTPAPPEPFGGGGGGRGGDGDQIPNPNERLHRYRMGLILAVASISMLFLAFTTLFLARRSAGKFDPLSGTFISDWTPVHLPVRLLLINTGILLLSCVTIEIARRQAVLETILVPATLLPGIRPVPLRSIAWVQTTALLGIIFLAGQWRAWELLHKSGHFFNSGAASSFVFLLTGSHAIHLTAGMLVLVYAACHGRQRRSFESRRITIDVTAWYWHFMGLLWIYLLGLLWFIG